MWNTLLELMFQNHESKERPIISQLQNQAVASHAPRVFADSSQLDGKGTEGAVSHTCSIKKMLAQSHDTLVQVNITLRDLLNIVSAIYGIIDFFPAIWKL